MLGKIPFLNGQATGHYKLAVVTGLTTVLAANTAIFAARWSSLAGIRALLLYLRVTAQVVTPFTAPQELNTFAQVGRVWTATPTGGTALAPLTSQLQNSLGDAASIIDARVATTAALGVGTVTIDPNPFMYMLANQMAAAPVVAVGSIMEWQVDTECRFPQNFNSAVGAQEGFLIKNGTVAQGAAGTVRYAIEMEWLEYQGAANVGSLV